MVSLFDGNRYVDLKLSPDDFRVNSLDRSRDSTFTWRATPTEEGKKITATSLRQTTTNRKDSHHRSNGAAVVNLGRCHFFLAMVSRRGNHIGPTHVGQMGGYHYRVRSTCSETVP